MGVLMRKFLAWVILSFTAALITFVAIMMWELSLFIFIVIMATCALSGLIYLIFWALTELKIIK